MSERTLINALRRKAKVFEQVEDGASETYLLLHQAADALEQDRATLNKVRKYAEEREAYGKTNRTVGSARIASDLFQIVGKNAE